MARLVHPLDKARAVRLLKRFEDQQHTDAPMAPSDLFALKYYLQHTKLCSLVQIKVDPREHGGPVFDCHFLPKFILSQFEAQKLIGTSLFPTWLLISIHKFLDPAGGNKDHYPTLFRWNLPGPSRTFYLFAYLMINMGHHIYTIPELMELRHSKVKHTKIPKLISNPEIGKTPTAALVAYLIMSQLESSASPKASRLKTSPSINPMTRERCREAGATR